MRPQRRQTHAKLPQTYIYILIQIAKLLFNNDAGVGTIHRARGRIRISRAWTRFHQHTHLNSDLLYYFFIHNTHSGAEIAVLHICFPFFSHTVVVRSFVSRQCVLSNEGHLRQYLLKSVNNATLLVKSGILKSTSQKLNQFLRAHPNILSFFHILLRLLTKSLLCSFPNLNCILDQTRLEIEPEHAVVRLGMDAHLSQIL